MSPNNEKLKSFSAVIYIVFCDMRCHGNFIFIGFFLANYEMNEAIWNNSKFTRYSYRSMRLMDFRPIHVIRRNEKIFQS